MTNARHRWRRSLAGAAIAGFGLLAAASIAPAQTTTPSTTTTTTASGSSGQGVTLNGEGSNGPYKEITTWQNDLSAAQTPINVQYTGTGTRQGRDDLISGTSDFALSGTQFNSGAGPGFTADQINQLPHKSLSRDIIAAPVEVSAAAFLLTPPYIGGVSGFQREDSGASGPSFISPIIREARIPWENLAAMLLNAGTPDPNPNDDWGATTASWQASAVMTAFGINPNNCDFVPPYSCFFGLGSGSHPAGVLQSEADELNYYMQLAFEEQPDAAKAWDANILADPSIKWTNSGGDVSEQIPAQPNLSRQGADQATDQLTLPGGTAGFGLGGNDAGAIGVLPPSALAASQQGAIVGASPLLFVAVQDFNGDWVQPTPKTIDNAVNASSQPLYALTHPVANAYPLTWVDYLYVKANGLSADKTEAMATLIRYLATDGQAAAAPWGEGTLSPALVTQALNAANQVVSSDCPGSGGQIVKNSSPGSDAPNLSGIDAIGTMLHCVAPPAAASTSSSSGGLGDVSLPGLPSAPSVPGQAPSQTPAVKPVTSLPDALAVAKLPIPLPGTPLDRIATVLAGGLLYLGLKDPIRRLLARATE
jgi:ABC-type phosphate transport system substrate-binding protein